MLNFGHQSPAVSFLLGIVEKDAATFTGDLVKARNLGEGFGAAGERSRTTDALSFREEPGLDGGDDVFKHFVVKLYQRLSRYS